jgi:uncharacterized protein YjiS (DUF1127 family)
MLPLKRVYHQGKQMLLPAHPSAFLDLPAPPRQRRFWPILVATLTRWSAFQRTRRHLATLTDRELADVGLTRTQQRVECTKPFWQA